MSENSVSAEPAEGFSTEQAVSRSKRPKGGERLDKSFFTLSGGIMKGSAGARTANRLEGLLSRMIEHPGATRYSADVERNLEFLHISLQLDMLDMMAREQLDREGAAPKDASPVRAELL